MYEMSEQVLLRCTEAWTASCAAGPDESPQLRSVQDAAFTGLASAKALRDAAWEACDRLLRERRLEAVRPAVRDTVDQGQPASSVGDESGSGAGRWTAAFTS